MKKGDTVSLVAQPIAKGIDWFLGTDLKSCGGCKRMRESLNDGTSFADAIYDRFFKSTVDSRE